MQDPLCEYGSICTLRCAPIPRQGCSARGSLRGSEAQVSGPLVIWRHLSLGACRALVCPVAVHYRFTSRAGCPLFLPLGSPRTLSELISSLPCARGGTSAPSSLTLTTIRPWKTTTNLCYPEGLHRTPFGDHCVSGENVALAEDKPESWNSTHQLCDLKTFMETLPPSSSHL